MDTAIFKISELSKKMFVEFLELDGDYTDNLDDFREDTLSLGYNNEAERVSEEYYLQLVKEYKDNLNLSEEERLQVLENTLEKIANDTTLDSQFFLGNQTYTKEYSIDVVCNDYDNLFENIYIFVAWTK